MKTEDFERLKAICEKEGFELVTESPKDNDKFFVVKKKDPWDGVEFVKVAKIHKVYRIDGDKIYFANNRGETWALKENCTQSTEEAYVKQLKKEAFERFGEIKGWDRFIDAYSKDQLRVTHSLSGFVYSKDLDSLCIGGVIIYYKGKWAERVKERVKVEGIHSGGSNQYDSESEWKYYFSFHLKNFDIDYHGAEKMYNKVLPFLAEQLEKYLNNEL